MDEEPWSPAAFERKYLQSVDPWSFASSPYEQGRYQAILDALAPEPHRYRSAFEPGCSVGVLTAQLSARCRALLATDVSPTAVDRARERCMPRAGLRIEVGSVEDDPADGQPFDLVVLSEVGYYLTRARLEAVVSELAEAMAGGGDLVACHWTGHSDDHVLHGSEVHEALAAGLATRADLVRSETHDGFLLDSWRLA